MALTTVKSAYVADTALAPPAAAPLIPPETLEIARRIPYALLLAAQATFVYGEAGRLIGRLRR